jgi:hypothetical protein
MKTVLGIALACSCALSAVPRLAAQEGKAAAPAVRPLPFKPADPTFAFEIGGQSKLTTLADVAAVEKLVGKAEAKALIGQVDFAKEKIVLVSWTTGGPPEGKLRHEVTGAGKDRRVTFYVQAPPGRGPRGLRARIAADFFAVPADLPATFDPRERN